MLYRGGEGAAEGASRGCCQTPGSCRSEGLPDTSWALVSWAYRRQRIPGLASTRFGQGSLTPAEASRKRGTASSGRQHWPRRVHIRGATCASPATPRPEPTPRRLGSRTPRPWSAALAEPPRTDDEGRARLEPFVRTHGAFASRRQTDPHPENRRPYPAGRAPGSPAVALSREA